MRLKLGPEAVKFHPILWANISKFIMVGRLLMFLLPKTWSATASASLRQPELFGDTGKWLKEFWRKLKFMDIIAIQKYVRISPQKLRVVVDMIKDLPPTDAVEKLPFVGKKAALPLTKAIKSALANAQVKGAKREELVFKEIQINEGPRLKRGMAGPRGKWKPYQKKMSHIRVILTTKVKKGEKHGTKS